MGRWPKSMAVRDLTALMIGAWADIGACLPQIGWPAGAVPGGRDSLHPRRGQPAGP
jgi:hypothetical protein